MKICYVNLAVSVQKTMCILSYTNIVYLSRYLFWSERSVENSGIKRSEMDGSNARTLIANYNAGRSTCLTIDFQQCRLYWVDIETEVIKSATLDGK